MVFRDHKPTQRSLKGAVTSSHPLAAIIYFLSLDLFILEIPYHGVSIYYVAPVSMTEQSSSNSLYVVACVRAFSLIMAVYYSTVYVPQHVCDLLWVLPALWLLWRSVHLTFPFSSLCYTGLQGLVRPHGLL